MNIKLKGKIVIENRQLAETPFMLTFEVTNKSAEELYILKFETPLEGMFSNCFDVTRNGEAIPYDGLMVKRRSPTRKDYLKLGPGESLINEVDLSLAYQISTPGNYEVTFRGTIRDVADKKELSAKFRRKEFVENSFHLKMPSRKFTVKKGQYGRATAGEAARRLGEDATDAKPRRKLNGKKIIAKATKPLAPKFNGGNNKQKTQTRKAHRDGYDLAVDALKTLANDKNYKEWFGAHTKVRFKKVKDTYQAVKDGMENTTFTYDLTGKGCKAGWYAYTTKGGTTIWMCSGFWNAPATGTDSKAGVVLHEHTHASASTDDLAYGQANCRALAKNKPANAVKNADSYEYHAGG